MNKIIQLLQGIRNVMAKILALLAGIAVSLGAIFAFRKSGATVVEGANIGPGIGGIGPVPIGSSPSGLRNNNPFNLIFVASIPWRGQTGSAGRFAVFDTSLNGIRAGMINIHTKMNRDNLKTVRKIITVLSPPIENPTEAFIQFVATRMGVSSDQPLIFSQHIIQLSKAIIQFENGQQPFTDMELQNALRESGK